MIQANKPAYQKLRSAPGITNAPERIEKDLAQAKQVAANFEAEVADTRGSEAIEKTVADLRGKKLEGIDEADEKAKETAKAEVVRCPLSHNQHPFLGGFGVTYTDDVVAGQEGARSLPPLPSPSVPHLLLLYLLVRLSRRTPSPLC
jgi:hypothetical protein